MTHRYRVFIDLFIDFFGQIGGTAMNQCHEMWVKSPSLISTHLADDAVIVAVIVQWLMRTHYDDFDFVYLDCENEPSRL